MANSGKTWAKYSMNLPGKGEPGSGRAFATRPCAHVDLDTAEICGFAGGWLYERQECDPYSADLPWPAEEL